MKTETQLVVIESSNALDLFTQDKGLDPVLENVRKIIDEFEPDPSTKKGRDAIASLAYSIAKSKTYLDGIGKQLVDDLKRKPKLVDAERKRMRDTLEQWKDEARKPLTEMEDKEKSVIYTLEGLLQCDDFSSIEIKSNLEAAMNTDIDFSVIKPKDLQAKKQEVIDALKVKHDRQLQYEGQQAELERMRKEQAEREAKEREERIAREAEERTRRELEQKAQREREEAELKASKQREAEQRQREEEQRKIEAEREAQRQKELQWEREREESKQRELRAAQQERERIELERKAYDEELQKRAEDKEHRRKVNNEVLQLLTESGISDNDAKKIITLAAKGEAGRLAINY